LFAFQTKSWPVHQDFLFQVLKQTQNIPPQERKPNHIRHLALALPAIPVSTTPDIRLDHLQHIHNLQLSLATLCLTALDIQQLEILVAFLIHLR
jgi:hypothetical protein